tara:strand:- start:402 stop:527 length:126 start_codon:yes stop_codon:yes gene_type:complete
MLQKRRRKEKRRLLTDGLKEKGIQAEKKSQCTNIKKEKVRV